MLVNEQLSIHDNHVSRVYLYDEKWVNKRVLPLDNDVDLITYMKKPKVIKQLSFHDNHVSRVYLNDKNVSKQTIIAPWQRRCFDYVFEETVSKRTHIHPWQQRLTCVLI